MMLWISRPYRWAKVYSAILICAFAFVLTDAFLIPKTYAMVETRPAVESSGVPPVPQTVTTADGRGTGTETEIITETQTDTETAAQMQADDSSQESVITADSYTDSNIQITIETVQEYDTTFYVADITVTDPEYLKAALAQQTYGRNIKQTTSEMAEDNQAILAVNGDYYGFRDTGYVLRNGVLYRDTGSGDALVIDQAGNFSVVDQSTITQELIDNAWQIFAFGPALVEQGTIVVDADSEVSQSKTSNPRTAIGQVSEGHYLIIVSDGRTNNSEGLSLLQLAQVFAERGAETAYNLDGGGSSTMVFNGTVINTPSSGRSNSEREVSDIVYIGYE